MLNTILFLNFDNLCDRPLFIVVIRMVINLAHRLSTCIRISGETPNTNANDELSNFSHKNNGYEKTNCRGSGLVAD